MGGDGVVEPDDGKVVKSGNGDEVKTGDVEVVKTGDGDATQLGGVDLRLEEKPTDSVAAPVVGSRKAANKSDVPEESSASLQMSVSVDVLGIKTQGAK
jgi:hypothetical protein